MPVSVDRRRLLAGFASYVAMPAFLQGCGGAESTGGGGIPIVPAPVGTPTPTATATPTPGIETPQPVAALKIAFAGSSSCQQYLSLYDGVASDARVRVSDDGSRFTTLTSGAFGKAAGALIANALRRDVTFIRGGVSGTTLSQWATPSSPQRAALVARIQAAQGVDALLVQVGRNDAADGIIAGTRQQTDLLLSLIERLRSEAGISRAVVFIGGSQDMTEGTTAQQEQLALQRSAERLVLSEAANVRYGFSTYDQSTYDGIHQTESAQLVTGRRFAAQVIAWAQGTAEVRGPRVGDIRIMNTQTEVTIIQGAGTDFTPGTGIDGFVLTTGMDNARTEIRIVGAERVNPTLVRVTHDPINSALARLSYASIHPVSDTACLRDNSSYALPMEPYS